MKNTNIIFTAVIIFALMIYLVIIGMETSPNRRFLYFYPNGYIANTDWKNSHVIGYNIYEGDKIPIIRVQKKPQTRFNFEFNLIQKWNVIKDFIPHLFISLIYIMAATWFLFRDGDMFLSFLFLNLAMFFFSDFILLGFDSFYFIFYFSMFLMAFLFIHLAFRLKGKDVSSKWLVPEVFFAVIFAFIGFTEKDSSEIFTRLSHVGILLILIAITSCVVVILYDLFRYRPGYTVQIKKVSLLSSFLIISILPYIIYKYNLFQLFPYTRISLIVAFGLFPLLFIYGTYRYTFIPEQFYFNSSILIFYLTVIVIISYSLTISFLSYINPIGYERNKQILNILFLIVISSSLSAVKHKLASWLDYWTFGRNKKLNKNLEIMASLIASPISMKATMNSLSRIIRETLDIGNMTILISGDEYPTFDFKAMNVIKLPSNSEIWQFFTSRREPIVTSYLAHGVGVRESVYKFLRKLEIQLAYPMFGSIGIKKISAVFLVGEKHNKTNFSLGELRFIKECTRLADLLLQNYQLLIAEVEKKKLVRDLNTVTIMDKTINPSQAENLKSLDICYLSIPAVGISGDYLDFIKLSEKKLMIFLGDVSGHGLGSGYLVSAIRAITRNMVQSGMDLPHIFNHINTFLIERYEGNEFMTLIGGIYDDDSRTFEFVNAGHLPILVLNTHGNILKEDFTHRVLGILPCNFTLTSIQLNTEDRLFLYSDGVTETFSPSDEIYGEERLKEFLRSTLETPIADLPSLLEQELQDFRKGNDMTDDISFICISKKFKER
ncbi:MAG: SpoIIE family protein phosphatase [Leptospiraceae bacterium]|nr:SpoIIE family protein phosphatase [Leptospiraceae bacterium]MCP5498360.1 SpoIIE family protein phosphatase [Leptospiraceae bacterium]